MATRKYQSELRSGHAALTRRRILDAAHSLLLEGGCAAMTNSALAAAAGVSPQTLYNAIGNKAAVLKAVYDRTLAGDDEPVPIAERPEFRAVLEAPDARALLYAYAHVGRLLAERVGPILAALSAATADDDIAALADTIDADRLRGNTTLVGHLHERFGLPAGLTVDDARDIVWTLTAPEPWHRLVVRRRWSHDRYERWLASALVTSLT